MNWYTLFFVLAILVGITYGLIFYKKLDTTRKELFYFAVFTAICGVLGSRLFSFLFRIDEAFESIEQFKALLFSGFMYYGGLLGGIIGIYVYCKRFKLNTRKYFDFCAIILPFCHMLGRLGCFFVGCCYGLPVSSDCFLGFDFNKDGNYYLATQLIEVVFNLILFIVLVLVGFKTKSKSGIVSYIYIYSYAIYRFIIEYFRYDDRGEIFGFSTAQFISLFLIGYATHMIVYEIRGKKDETCNSAS